MTVIFNGSYNCLLQSFTSCIFLLWILVYIDLFFLLNYLGLEFLSDFNFLIPVFCLHMITWYNFPLAFFKLYWLFRELNLRLIIEIHSHLS
jgi:hypothetical protein